MFQKTYEILKNVFQIGQFEDFFQNETLPIPNYRGDRDPTKRRQTTRGVTLVEQELSGT